MLRFIVAHVSELCLLYFYFTFILSFNIFLYFQYKKRGKKYGNYFIKEITARLSLKRNRCQCQCSKFDFTV